MTLIEILEHENIRSDRYAMAAISCIFKAFGDPIRSKEYWPWGKDVQCEWLPSIDTDQDITQAELLLERARVKFEEEQDSSSTEYKKITGGSMNDLNKQIKDLRRRLNKASLNIKKVAKANKEISEVSDSTSSSINKISS